MAEVKKDIGEAIQQGAQVPMHAATETMHVGADDLPWLESEDGSKIKVLHVDLNQGLFVVKTRWKPGYAVQTHYHTGSVFAVTYSGSWYYKEYPDTVNRAGSYLYEPAHSLHTLLVSEDNEEDTEVWFAIYGCNINVDEGGSILGLVDASIVMEYYREGCRNAGFDSSNMIVIGDDLK
jgi:quercetin dioxygenase-like cupin family protein